MSLKKALVWQLRYLQCARSRVTIISTLFLGGLSITLFALRNYLVHEQNQSLGTSRWRLPVLHSVPQKHESWSSWGVCFVADPKGFSCLKVILPPPHCDPGAILGGEQNTPGFLTDNSWHQMVSIGTMSGCQLLWLWRDHSKGLLYSSQQHKARQRRAREGQLLHGFCLPHLGKCFRQVRHGSSVIVNGSKLIKRLFSHVQL